MENKTLKAGLGILQVGIGIICILLLVSMIVFFGVIGVSIFI
jgi:hypothetical protein